MANLPANGQITTAGDYDFKFPPNVVGNRYLITFKTTAPASSNVTIQFNNGINGTFQPVDGGAYLAATSKTEDKFTLTSDTLRIVATTVANPIQVTLTATPY